MKIVKKGILYLIPLLLIVTVIIYHKEIPQFVVKKMIYHNDSIKEIKKNEYAQEKNYELVQITDDFVAKDKKHLLNIFYTILDSGESSFYFYCSDDYKGCQEDIEELIPNEQNKESILADLNNYVHPYNSYKTIEVTPNSFGKISIIIQKQYSEQKIKEINVKIEEIKSSMIENQTEEQEKIKAFHDYIVNNTTYDMERAKNMGDPIYQNSTTHTAYGLLENKKALCGGYSDIMSIFLYQLGIPNIRISANNHVWNLVQLKDTWLHLDVTWDDPVTNTGEELLIYDYFLIPYQELIETDPVEHKFNSDIYIEAK